MKRAALALCLLAGCGGAPAAPSDAASPADLADGGCSPSQIPLEDYPATGAPAELYVRVEYQGAPAAFLVDTGSEATFLQEPLGSPDPANDAGSVTFGCETYELIGRPEASLGTAFGDPVVGTLGAHFLLNGPTLVDFTHQLIERHANGDGFPQAASWPETPYIIEGGIAVAQASLDDTPVHLEVDTGAGSVIWVGVQPNPGDTPIPTEDAMGNPITIYMGTVTLTIGSRTGTVPCGRVPTWPAFTQGTQEMGGNIQGLVGLSGLGQGFVFDTDAQVVRVDE